MWHFSGRVHHCGPPFWVSVSVWAAPEHLNIAGRERESGAKGSQGTERQREGVTFRGVDGPRERLPRQGPHGAGVGGEERLDALLL